MGSSYEVTWLSRLLHSFPHLDLTFKTINSTFNPHSAHYREVSRRCILNDHVILFVFQALHGQTVEEQPHIWR